jgi:hypothetical protein
VTDPQLRIPLSVLSKFVNLDPTAEEIEAIKDRLGELQRHPDTTTRVPFIDIPGVYLVSTQDEKWLILFTLRDDELGVLAILRKDTD